MRVLLEPILIKALVLAARKRGMRAGEYVRRLLTAIVCHDLADTILNTKPRAYKIASITVNIAHKPPTALARVLQRALAGRIDTAPSFELAAPG